MYKHALLIGIGYRDNSKYYLQNSYNQVKSIKKHLITEEGYLDNNIYILTDFRTSNGSFHDVLYRPTKVNIFQSIEKMIKKTSVFIDPVEIKIFYVGYGRNVFDDDLNLNRNECILPSCGNIILAEELMFLLNSFNSNCNIECILDNCLSNCVFNFSNNYNNLDNTQPTINLYMVKNFNNLDIKNLQEYKKSSGVIIKAYLDPTRRWTIYKQNNLCLT